jgi:hypothetical protein
MDERGVDERVVANEFASVSVSIDAAANSPRLRLEDLKTGRVRFLDALELETLVWASDDDLRGLLDPSANRWQDDEPEAKGE